MIMKLLVNYTQSFHGGNTVLKPIIYYNLIPELQHQIISKKTINHKVKRFINKLSLLHWYDGVKDDLDFNL